MTLLSPIKSQSQKDAVPVGNDKSTCVQNHTYQTPTYGVHTNSEKFSCAFFVKYDSLNFSFEYKSHL